MLDNPVQEPRRQLSMILQQGLQPSRNDPRFLARQRESPVLPWYALAGALDQLGVR